MVHVMPQSRRTFERISHSFVCEVDSGSWHLLVPSRRLKSTRRGFSGRFCQKCSRILRCLARQWIHVCVSVRVCGASLSANRDRYEQCELCLQFVDVGGCAILGSRVDTCTASAGGFTCRSRFENGACEGLRFPRR